MGILFGVLIVPCLIVWLGLSIHTALAKKTKGTQWRSSAWLSALTPLILVAYAYLPELIQGEGPEGAYDDGIVLLLKDILLVLAILAQTGAVFFGWKASRPDKVAKAPSEPSEPAKES